MCEVGGLNQCHLVTLRKIVRMGVTLLVDKRLASKLLFVSHATWRYASVLHGDPGTKWIEQENLTSNVSLRSADKRRERKNKFAEEKALRAKNEMVAKNDEVTQ